MRTVSHPWQPTLEAQQRHSGHIIHACALGNTVSCHNIASKVLVIHKLLRPCRLPRQRSAPCAASRRPKHITASPNSWVSASRLRALESKPRTAINLWHVAGQRYLGQAKLHLSVLITRFLQVSVRPAREQPCTVSVDRATAASPQSLAPRATPLTAFHHRLRGALCTPGRTRRPP